MSITITPGVESLVPGGSNPNGPNFGQVYPEIIAEKNGDYLITWLDTNAFGQLYAPSGQTIGSNLQLNTSTTPLIYDPPTAAPLAAGGFVVTWTAPPTTGTFDGSIYAQRFDASGAKVGSEARVDGDFGYAQGSVVAGLAGGGYVVAWASDYDNNQLIDHIYAQQFDASGVKVGGEFEVSPDTAPGQVNASVTALTGGGYVIAWQTESINGTVYTQQYNATGGKVGGATAVTSAADTNQSYGHVAALTSGGYVVVWAGAANDGTSDVYSQVFNSSGAKVGPAVLVNTTTAGGQTEPTAVGTPGGGWFVAWVSDQSGGGVYSQAFDSSGNRVGGETLQPLAAGTDAFPVATVLANGTVVLAWETEDGNGNWSLVQKVLGASVVSPNLTTAVESAVGDAANDTFLAAPGTINAGDRIDGGGGQNILQLTAAQTADFTNVSIAHVQEILGSPGVDTLIFPNGPPSGVTFVSGGGKDVLALGGTVDLSALSLSGSWTVAPAPGQFADFKLTSTAQIAEISGAGGDLTVDASALALTPAQITQLLNQGVSDVIEGAVTYRQGGGILFSQPPAQVSASMQIFTPDVAQLAGGDLVAAFRVQSNSGPAIFFQLLDGLGNKIGDAVAVDGGATQDQAPAVTALAGGGFVVVWDGYDPNNGYALNNYLQAYDAQGDKVGGMVKLGGTATPEIAALSDGGYVVVWQSGAYLNSPGADVGYQRFDAQGALVASGSAATATYGDQIAPVVAPLSGGGWVTAWIDKNTFGSDGVHFQVFNAAGAAVGAEQAATTQTQFGASQFVSVGELAGGGFVLTWTDFSVTDKGDDIYAERFDASGAAVGSAFQVNASDPGHVSTPAVAGTSDGGFVISWLSSGATPSVVAQLYDSAGHAVGPADVLATVVAPNGPAVAGLPRGGFVVTYAVNPSNGLVANVTTGVSAVLTAGADTFHGNDTDLLVVTPAGGLSAGDVVTGGAGRNTLEMMSAGVLDFTLPATFSGFGAIMGSSGADSFIFSTARLAGVTQINGGGGTNTIVAADGALNLGGVSLANIQSLSTNDALGTLFTVPTSAGALAIAGAAGFDRVAFGVAASSASFTHNPDGTWSVGLGGGVTDVLTSIELAQFTDRAVSLVAQWTNRDNFDGSSKGGFLIENTSGAVFSATVASGHAVFHGLGGLGSEWSFRGDGDFSGDGRSGFLIENAAGALDVGEAQAGGSVVYKQISALGPEWSFGGTGDFNADGQSDFVIENTSGAVFVGLLGPNEQVTYTQIAALGPEWKFRAVGDFLGDGKADFLIENAAGAVVVGEMGPSGAAVYTQVTGLGPEWSFRGAGDFLGDGKSDFLIENTAGAVFVGEVGSNHAATFTQIAALGPEWKFVGAADYLGEGHDQVLIENAAGAVVVGDYQSGAIHYTVVGSLGSEWGFH